MSGIFGFYSNDNISGINLDALNKWNSFYGTETERYETDNALIGAYIEHLSCFVAPIKPIVYKDSCSAVIDAVIYNREELRDELGIKSDDINDEELLLCYVLKFGFSALAKVNGDFSGAVFNSKSNELTLFRDHMGIRPLFYYLKDNVLSFSTDYRGITGIDCIDKSVNEDWLYKVLAGYIPYELTSTEFKYIKCLEPGSFSVFRHGKDGKISQTHSKYWTLGSSRVKLSSKEEYIKKLRELVEDSIDRRLAAIDVKIGAELSGGLDSGVIDILLNRKGADAEYFSWSASTEDIDVAERDERLIIEDICKQENITCNYWQLHPKEDRYAHTRARVSSKLGKKEYMGSLDIDFVFPPYVDTYRISETSNALADKGVKVIFTGHGGDEGVSHRSNPYELLYHGEFFRYFECFWKRTKGENLRFPRAVKRMLDNNKIAYGKLKVKYENPFSAKDYINEDFDKKYTDMEAPVLNFAFDSIAFINQAGSRMRLDNVALQGAMCGIRYIVPYLDYRVIDYAVSIPRYLYHDGYVTRYIFREAFKDIMPESLYKLATKRDFSWDNFKPDPDPGWKENVSRAKKEYLDILDWNYWNKYLDERKIRQWANSEVSEKDSDDNNSIMITLSGCILFQELIKKSKTEG